ncbi:MAG: hypothetical protein IPI67_10300 [Myxococcales bacterium]|nr:hypothetical protein [Myxococcales bacterium]
MAKLELAELLLGLMLQHGHPGQSPYSRELVPECRTNTKAAGCELAPECAEPSALAAPPSYSVARGGWTRVETRPHALRRFAGIARALAATSKRLYECTEPSCEPLAWPGSQRSLALATLTVALHESGLREDVQFGHPPLGRGPHREACLVQVALDQGPRVASWIPSAERDGIIADARAREEFASSLLGDTAAALGRCFEVGMRLLSRSRRACGAAGVAWDFGMFSLYGGGRSCNFPPIGRTRAKTFRGLAAAKPAPSDEITALLAQSSEP